MPICSNAINKNACEHGQTEQHIDQFINRQSDNMTITCLTCRERYQKLARIIASYDINSDRGFENINVQWLKGLVGR